MYRRLACAVTWKVHLMSWVGLASLRARGVPVTSCTNTPSVGPCRVTVSATQMRQEMTWHSDCHVIRKWHKTWHSTKTGRVSRQSNWRIQTHVTYTVCTIWRYIAYHTATSLEASCPTHKHACLHTRTERGWMQDLWCSHSCLDVGTQAGVDATPASWCKPSLLRQY